MVNQTIQIFARLKPTRKKTGPYLIDEDSTGNPRVAFTIPKDAKDGLINNKKEQYKFRFEKIFDQNTVQDDVFEHVAKHVADSVLEGYNGTIFAYGQTGSGKTFTITGGPEKYADRGIIPRTLSYMFDTFEKYPDREYSTQISYLEIYNDSGYDLLDPLHEAAKLEDLPKVTLYEDAEQNIHLKNLSTHAATNEEDALNLLFMGDTNRMIAETPMNQASTRSHCIFTVHILSRVVGQATVRRSKLHLVDLAGSERVGKTGTNGVLLTEAKYINLSLHYLEQVIVALSEKNRQHIPYRNSMMTSVLRDSLGGNCMTTMIATCSVERQNIDESISTCRFAQRVALIKNDAVLNEELDPKLMIGRLKREIEGLKEELAMATGEQRTDELTQEEMDKCGKVVNAFLDDRDVEATLAIGADMRKIQYCFRFLKTKLLEQPTSSQGQTQVPENEDEKPYSSSVYENQENDRLQQLVQQRDNEINILVGMLKKEKQRAAQAMATGGRQAAPSQSDQSTSSNHKPPLGKLQNGHREARYRAPSDSSDAGDPAGYGQTENVYGRYKDPTPPDTAEQRRQDKILGDMSLGRQEAYEIFKRDYDQNISIDDNKTTLKQRYLEAKTLGEQVNVARNEINKIKSHIEHHRMTLVMKGLVDPSTAEPDQTEVEYRELLEAQKERYKVSFSRLRTMKTEIEHLQHLLEKQKVQMMKDFEVWWAEQSARVEAQQKMIHDLPKSTTRGAWRTPPVTPSNRDGRPPSVQSTAPSESQASVASESYSLGPLRHAPSAPQPVAGGRHTGHAGSGRHAGYHGAPSAARTFVKTPDQSLPTENTTSQTSSPSSALTGDPDTDADIIAFLDARKQVVKRMNSQKR